MPSIVTDDGVTLHAEETGSGEPLLFIHEFAGDHRSWEPQVRFFSAAYRCVTYAARGYLPSDVPSDPDAYSQAWAVADAIAVLDGLGIARAHVAGLSMGGFTALTMRGVQAARPSLYALTDDLAKVRIPVLVLVGNEDDGCLEPALMLKRTIPTSGLAVLPRTGHTANLEEPDVFNQAVDRFLGAVARGSWHPRDPRSVSDSTMGLR